MSWFDTTGFASFAKSALTSAQKTIDKALDIQDEKTVSHRSSSIRNHEEENFFAAFGLVVTPGSPKEKPLEYGKVEHVKTNPQTECDNAQNSGFWSDTWGSFFETKPIVATNAESADVQQSVDECLISSSPVIKDNAVLSQPIRASPFPCSSNENAKDMFPIEIVCTDEDFPTKIISELKTVTQLNENQLSVDCQNSKLLCSADNIHNQGIMQPDVMSDSGLQIEPVQATDSDNKSNCSQENSVFIEETQKIVHEECSNMCIVFEEKETYVTDEKLNVNTEQSETNNSCILSLSEVSESINITKKDDSDSKNSHNSINSDFQSVGNCSTRSMEESQFLSLDLSSMMLSPTSVKPKSEIGSNYDLIDTEANINDSSNNSRDQSPSVEIVTPVSQGSCYDSCSPMDFPQIHSDMTTSFINWEWGPTDGNSGDLPNSSCETVIDPENARTLNSQPSSVLNDQDQITCKQLGIEHSLYDIVSSTSSDLNNHWIGKTDSGLSRDSCSYSSESEISRHINEGSTSSKEEEEDTETADIKDCEVKSSDSGGSQGTTSSSSFVKCSAEEADGSSHRGQSPLSAATSDRSDLIKVESEQYSGHTSGDENETTTSSDIEILSPSNGESSDRRSISPLKHMWVPHPLRPRRSESPASDSSKDSILPAFGENTCLKSSAKSNLKNFYKHSKPPSTSYKKSLQESDSFEKLIQRQEELEAILEVRETKILELSKENVKLQEIVDQCKKQINQMILAHNKETQDISSLTKEFTQRLAQMENKLQHANQEKEQLKKQLERAQTEVVNRVTAAELENIIKEKDQQINELLSEGKKLSMKELQLMNAIKKRKSKEDELERTVKSQAEKLDENSKEVERLRISLWAKDEQEKKHIDAIRQLTTTVQKQEKEIAASTSTLEDFIEKERSTKNVLDSTYKEMSELQKANADKEKQIQELTLSVEMAANEKLRESLEQASKEANKEKESLLRQMEDLRSSLLRSEEDANLREQILKADIASLQLRIQESEARNEELTKNMSSATRPLVRQIENLQAAYNTQIASWEKVEKNLTDRLIESQNQLAIISEREKSASEKYLELGSKVAKLESQNSTLRQEKLYLSSQLEMLNSKMMMLEDEKNRDMYSIENLKQSHASETARCKDEKESLASDMLKCLNQLETERKMVRELKEELKQKEAKLLLAENLSPCPSPSVSHKSSVDSIHNWLQEEPIDPSLVTPTAINYRLSVYESLRLGSTSSLLENLQSQLKQREGEINQLQSDIAKLERVRNSVSQELVDLSEQNETLESEVQKLKGVEEEYKALDQKYNTLLQMYGEKVEETEELHLDLQDVKSMYKAQIEELLRKI